mmetsp:Transcript_26145/g.44486  ORF Transcript_26145/g.44486 Transcript_26145/m.44486 type:complete len:234 (-) Transcript_26145:525-1226(-)
MSKRRNHLFPLTSNILLSNLIKQHTKYQSRPHRSLPRHGVPKQHTRNTNRHHLPRCHDDGKHDRSKLLNGCINEQLPRCRCNCRDYIVLQHVGVHLEEFNNFGNVSPSNQTHRSHDNCRAIHTQHHLIRVHIGLSIFVIYLTLPLTCERIECNVRTHEEQPNNFRGGIRIRTFTGNTENCHSHRNQECLQVLRVGIIRPLEEFAHDHYRDNFGTLEDRLDGETYISQTRILTP